MTNYRWIHRSPIKNIESITFLTRFNAALYGFFTSEHVVQLTTACPNLQQLNLKEE